jgi:Zn-dependent protease
MRNSFRIARIMGINIGVDASWFIILFLLIFEFGFIEFPRELRPRSFFARPDWVSISLGIAASLLLFASVLAHELSHSWMAIRRGIPVVGITLFIFGGVAQIADEPDRPASEFLIAIMGPLMSVALAALFGALWIWLQVLSGVASLGNWFAPMILLFGILAQANGALAIFNLAPGFPLDGGRVFRAILWGAWHDVRRATLWASRTGQLIAVGFVALGGWTILRDGNFGGFWYIILSFFLWNAAREGYRQTLIRESLKTVTVEQLMQRDVKTISPNLSISEFIEQYLLRYRDHTYGVADGADCLGIVAADHIRRVPRAERARQHVRDILTSFARLAPIAPNETGAAALARLARSQALVLPVMQAGELIGFVGHDEIYRYLRIKAEF